MRSEERQAGEEEVRKAGFKGREEGRLVRREERQAGEEEVRKAG